MCRYWRWFFLAHLTHRYILHHLLINKNTILRITTSEKSAGMRAFFICRGCRFAARWKPDVWLRKPKRRVLRSGLCLFLWRYGRQGFFPSIHLHDRDIILFLVGANLRTDIHAAREQLQQFAVDVIDFAAQVG